jgi:ribonuclease BN (tRNA processing enzyme)
LVHLSGAPEPDRSLPELVQSAFDLGPASIHAIEAQIDLYELNDQSCEPIPGVRLTPFYANHPGRTLGFVFETHGRKIVYAPDSEVYGESATAMQDYDERFSKLAAGAELMIHDGRYLPEDYQVFRNGGHSNFLSVVDLAGRSGVKRLILFHHDDRYNDATLDQIGSESVKRVVERGYKLECVLARPGLKVEI